MAIVKYDLLELSQIWYSKVLNKQGEGGSNKQGGGNGIFFLGGGRKWLIGYLSALVWPSRHLLHRKMTKEKSKEDIKYFFMKIFNAAVTSKQNYNEKYHRLTKNVNNQNCSWKKWR